MNQEEKLEAIREELARQDDLFAAARTALEALGDVDVQLPNELVEQLEGRQAHASPSALPYAVRA